MRTEIEAKFLNMNHDAIRESLRIAGGVCGTPMRTMRRAIIDYPDNRLQKEPSNSFVRVRDEGEKTTLTYKSFTALSVDGAREIEIEVSSFDDAVAIFVAAGLVVISLQESKRETWNLDACEIVLDEWPWLNPYIEIEGASEQCLQDLTKKIGLDWNDAVFGDVMVAYKHQYPHLLPHQVISTLPEVRFGAPPPDFLVSDT